MATGSERRLTYEDYVHFPEGERWEVIDGEAYVVPSPNRRHQRVLMEIARQLLNHLKGHGGGEAYVAPFDVVLDPSDVLQPDVVFVADEHMGALTEANVWGTPTWVIEVLSPSHPERDRMLKFQRYQRFGVPEYWIVDPEQETVEIYRLDSGSYGAPQVLQPPNVATPLRPAGFALDLEGVFRG